MRDTINLQMQAKVNSDKVIDLEFKDNLISILNRESEIDIKENGPQSFNIIRDSKVYNVEILSREGKAYELSVNGIPYSVQLKDKLDITLSKMGIDQSSQSSSNDVKAPMPGLILDVLVEAGTVVEKGQPLLILEAMKMENVLKSSSPGTVSEVLVEKGASVEKNKVLIRF